MSALPFTPFTGPLPPGWTEHTGPNGVKYYFHANTQESTYVRPLPPPPSNTVKPKKEKPSTKTPIPGTDWLRVKTNEGNTFYFHPVNKTSLWTVPPEIKEAVEAFERASADPIEQERNREVERVKAEVEALVKRKADDGNEPDSRVSKKAKVEDEEESESSDDDGPEEDWEKEAAEQLAAEAKKAEEEAAARKIQQKVEEELAKRQKADLKIPDRVDLSIDEAKALFKTLLREKDINPLHPWDSCLPLFVSDPRYVLLPSVAARRDAFDEYCRERARELRSLNTKQEKEPVDSKAEFERLLSSEVKSTRTSWSEFRRTWKKDRRFYGWGRDDREREKRFREFLKDLGEKKRAASQKAEADFFALLKQSKISPEGNGKKWGHIKRSLSRDPRYDAVGSSSLREELFNTFRKAQLGDVEMQDAPKPEDDNKSPSTSKAAESLTSRKERALKEREDKVKAERSRMEASIDRSRNELNKEEGEREFKTLLTDAIREPQLTWEDALPQLQTDPRFTNSILPLNQQLHLFHSHVSHLRERHIKGLYALFESYAPTLASKFDSLPLDSLLSSLPATKLGYDSRNVQQDFEKWQRERTTNARTAFDEMLTENAFVEFWGRLGKIGGEGVDGGVKADDLGEGEGEGGGGTVDMKALAKNVDVGEMEKVLKASNDKRYIMFEHVPEQREKWIRSCQCPRDLHPRQTISAGVECISASFAMRLLPPILLSLSLFSSLVGAEENVLKERHDYQSDVARLRKIVINSLYSHKEIFLRELISNANDALEKLRLTSLTDKTVWDGSDNLNITIKAVKNEGGPGGAIIITDTGIGMTPEDLKKNLGTLAKSGTSEFLSQAEGQDSTGTGNLIGAFGLGFYSSFLVADRVEVASLPPPSKAYPEPVQHVFASSADESAFDVFPDPRGNTLGRGTEITLYLKDDAFEYLETTELTRLVNKHSSFSSSFPIYLFTQRTEQVPEEVEPTEEPVETPAEDTSASEEEKPEAEPFDEDEGIVEDVIEEKEEPVPEPPKMKDVVVDEWKQLNSQPPLWTRDPKTISDEEYQEFYKATFKDHRAPLAWHHFSGDSGSGVSFKAIIFLPAEMDPAYWQQPLEYQSKDVRLMVKRVFITNDLGEDALPKWAGWVKVVVDADDLPLNVSRETLQSNVFLRQLKQIIVKRLIQLFTRIADDEPGKWIEVQRNYGAVHKLAAVEDLKNRDKLLPLTRFATNQRDKTSLDQYLENKKKGQKQIFYLSEMGKGTKDLAKSVFVEKLDARGYEVLLLNEPLDEILVQNVRVYKTLPFQDVAKAGLKFGDEDLDAEEEKALQKEMTEKFQPLLDYLKKEAGDVVRDVVISNRLVASPCAVVADSHGYTANIQRMMSAANKANKNDDFMHEIAMKAKFLEINPRSPLIEGLLKRVEAISFVEEEGDRDLEAEGELKEVISILIDGALIRSGFDVPDTNDFFSRVDRVLRRSLGVSETAPTDTNVKPAPPVDPELPDPEELFGDDMFGGKAGIHLPDHMKEDVQIEMEEIDEFGNVVVHEHDEL
ncbi:HSP90-domain-containing protein [Hymenopellis radicata]|nr:HSP90-domain-containing protein [Hymenopellis radicata]